MMTAVTALRGALDPASFPNRDKHGAYDAVKLHNEIERFRNRLGRAAEP
jgi:hypothetical protein